MDEDKLHASNGENITDMSFLKLVIDEPPAKTVSRSSFFLERLCTENNYMANVWEVSQFGRRRFANGSPALF